MKLVVHLCFCPQVNVTTVREHLPKGDFSIMTEMLKKFLSFMNLTVSMSITTDLHLLCSMISLVLVLIQEIKQTIENLTLILKVSHDLMQ